jgi:hypothetical protein
MTSGRHARSVFECQRIAHGFITRIGPVDIIARGGLGARVPLLEGV